MVKKSSIATVSSQFLQDTHQDSVSVPNALLRAYQQIGLTELEVVTLLRLLYIHSQGQGRLTPRAIAAEFACAPEEAAILLRPFIGKQLLAYHKATESYSMDGLFDQLYELWAIKKSRAKAVNADRGHALSQANQQADQRLIPELGQLYQSFERELGRSLSPIENEKISQWLADGQQAALIEEALRRAVLQGKPGFAYIDKILLNWCKLNICTVAEIELKDRPPLAGAAGMASRPTATSRSADRSRKNGERIKDTWLERAR